MLWSRVIERPVDIDAVTFERSVILELVTTVVQPYGIIWANDRARHLSSDAGDPSYRVLIRSGRGLPFVQDPLIALARAELNGSRRPIRLRDRLLLSVDHLRARVSVRLCVREDGTAPPDRALQCSAARHRTETAERAAYHLLSIALFYRGEIDAACAIVDRAIAMNLTTC